MPRMIALAEALWTPKEQKNWKDFFNRLSVHFDRLDKMNINYRIPEIEGLYDSHVFVDTDTIKLSHIVENQEIRYTLDGSTPTKQSTLYKEPIIISKALTFSARPFSKTGRGGDILKTEFVKTDYISSIEVKEPNPGINYDYYEGSSWKNVNDIGQNDHKIESSSIATFDLPEIAIKKKSTFVVDYTGFIKIEEDGVYTFSLLCDDAGVLSIANQIVIDNDGMHSPRKKIGQIALKKGFHPIQLQYIEGGGGGVLKLQMLKNGEFKTIDAHMLFR
jgi:hexosaminidase